jgi:hypothetical protein
MAITKVSLNLEYLVNAWKGGYSRAYGVFHKALAASPSKEKCSNHAQCYHSLNHFFTLLNSSTFAQMVANSILIFGILSIF